MLRTPLNDLLGIQHPIMCAGMNGVATSELVAAVSNAGGIGCIGGLLMTPRALQQEIKLLKQDLLPGKPWGVDLAIPAIGGTARKTNYDYTDGNLDELIDITIEAGAKIFVCAIGIPPPHLVEKLHKANVVVFNMIGAPHHAIKALDAGVDVVIAQGTEGGGHTGSLGTIVLIPQVVDVVKGRKNYWGQPIQVIGAGGIGDGRAVAAALSLGATGVWVGTRFVNSEESAAPPAHKKKIISAKTVDTVVTLSLTGRPIRLLPNQWVKDWEKKPEEMAKLAEEGQTAMKHSLAENPENLKPILEAVNSLSGQVCGSIADVLPAKQIVDNLVADAVAVIQERSSQVLPAAAKL